MSALIFFIIKKHIGEFCFWPRCRSRDWITVLPEQPKEIKIKKKRNTINPAQQATKDSYPRDAENREGQPRVAPIGGPLLG